MRELQIAWNIVGVVLVLDGLRGGTSTVWPGLAITVVAAIGFAILLEQPRRALIERLTRQRARKAN